MEGGNREAKNVKENARIPTRETREWDTQIRSRINRPGPLSPATFSGLAASNIAGNILALNVVQRIV